MILTECCKGVKEINCKRNFMTIRSPPQIGEASNEGFMIVNFATGQGKKNVTSRHSAYKTDSQVNDEFMKSSRCDHRIGAMTLHQTCFIKVTRRLEKALTSKKTFGLWSIS